MIDINAIWIQLQSKISNLKTNYYYSSDSINEAIRFYSDTNGNVCTAVRVKLSGNILEGQLLQCSTTSGYVTITAVDSDMPVGVALQDGADGQYIWMAMHGVVRVLFKTGVTGTAGYVVYASDTAGYADNSATVPSVGQHNREVGHVYETGTSGGYARVLLTHAN